MHGFSGSGKSTKARLIAQTAPAVLLATDVIRKELSEPMKKLNPDAYEEEKRLIIYGSMLTRARHWLNRGENVILDATFLARCNRDRARAIADGVADFRLIDCTCPDEELRLRLRERAAKGGSVSDATEHVYELQLREADPLREDEPAETAQMISAQGLQKRADGSSSRRMRAISQPHRSQRP
jgi:predicted kinase